MSSVGKWFLCCENGTHDDILLPEDRKAIIIGRGPFTKIKDQKLSRNQGNCIDEGRFESLTS